MNSVIYYSCTICNTKGESYCTHDHYSGDAILIHCHSCNTQTRSIISGQAISLEILPKKGDTE